MELSNNAQEVIDSFSVDFGSDAEGTAALVVYLDNESMNNPELEAEIREFIEYKNKKNKRTRISELHKKWSENEDYRAAYDALAPEFNQARADIRARN